MDTRSYEPAGYDTDLSDAEWELLKPLIYAPEARRRRGRRREPDSARANLDAIRYILKTGCQWSLLPKEFASLRSPFGQPSAGCLAALGSAQEHRA